MTKQKFKLEAEIVNGKCPTCDQFTMLVGVSQDFFRCMSCGSDLEQHINGKITYLPIITAPSDGGKPFVTEEHPFKTIDGWKAIDPFLTYEKHQVSSNVLNLQDIVYKIDGKEIIELIEKGKTIYPKVYNLSLDNEHVYYANRYLVHNNKFGAMGDDLIDWGEVNPFGEAGNISGDW